MRVAVFGLGYVGTVSAACLADMGHVVIGVEVNRDKLAAVRRGVPPVTEPGLDALLSAVVASGRLQATEDGAEAVQESEVSLICVGTPGAPNGSLDFGHLERVLADIGNGLRRSAGYHVVVVRSTVLPQSLHERFVPVLEQRSGKGAGKDFGVCVNPEFLREGTAIADFRSPSFTIIGQWDARSGDHVAGLYTAVSAPVVRVTPDEACMIKYASNAFHALKVVFANEVGAFCKRLGIDSHRVMDTFCQDTVLNIAPAYLKPGFAFGGSCLPKDLRALLYASRKHDVELPVLSAILPSNQVHIGRALELVNGTGKRRVGLLGLSFKAGTDDLRESPYVGLAETLLGKGYDVKIYDDDVSLSRLVGRNLEYITAVLPHVARLFTSDLDAMIAQSDVLIVAKKELRERVRPESVRRDLTVIELSGRDDWNPALVAGIAW
jgi:GDP-mannose 6-dehydrogenase